MVCELVEFIVVLLRTIPVDVAEAILPITVAIMYNGITVLSAVIRLYCFHFSTSTSLRSLRSLCAINILFTHSRLKTKIKQQKKKRHRQRSNNQNRK